MNAKSLAVFLFLAAFVAGALWFALAPSTSPTLVPATTTAAADAPAAPPTASPISAASAAVGGEERGAAGLRTAVEPGAAAGLDLAQVRARIVDAAGRPRAGVELTLTTSRAPDSALDVFVEQPDRAPSPSGPRVRSDGDGRVDFTLPRGSAGALGLVDAGLVFAAAPPRARGDKGDQDLGDIAVVGASVLRGRVEDVNGSPLAGAIVVAERGLFGIGGERRVTSSANGMFAVDKLAPGALTLRVGLAGHVPSAQDLELKPEEQRDGFVVTLRVGKAVAGRVVDDRGAAVAGIRVGFNRMEMRGGIGFERFASEEAATTDQNGWFALAGLGDDAVTVRTVSKEHAPAAVADVAVGTMDVLLRVERLGAIEGVLVGADGAPIEGSEVRLASPGGGDASELLGDVGAGGAMAMMRNGAARSGADGAFRIDGVKPGAVTVRATGKGHRPAKFDGVKVVAAQTTKGIRLVADRGAVARVRVVDAGGAPVAGAKVKIAQASRGDRGVGDGGELALQASAVVVDGGDTQFFDARGIGRGTTDAEGRCEIPGLPAGDVEVQATHPDHAAALPAAVVLPALGTVDVPLTLRQPGFLTLTVLGADGSPVAAANVVLAPAGDDGMGRDRLTTDAQGVAKSRPLAPGQYTAVLARAAQSRSRGPAAGINFTVMGGGGDVIEGSRIAVTVSAGQTVEATLRQPVLARVTGVVTGADGPVAGCVVELQRSGELNIVGFGSSSPKSTTARDGSYQFDGVDAGEYTLSFGRPKAVARSEAPLAVPAGLAEVRQDLVLRTGRARLRVLDEASGQPIAGAEVELRRADAGGGDGDGGMRMGGGISFGVVMTADGSDDDGGMSTLTFGAQKARTDEQGVVVFEDVPVGSWQFAVADKRHVGKDAGPVAVVERQTADAGDVALVGAGSIRGDVVGVDGGKVAFGLVEHRPVGDAEWGQQVVANGGRFRINSLPAGRRELRARRIGLDGQQGEPGPVVEVEVKAGEAATAQLRAN
jgi:protocatechuate 3,4-dioxygenase beta subunit